MKKQNKQKININLARGFEEILKIISSMPTVNDSLSILATVLVSYVQAVAEHNKEINPDVLLNDVIDFIKEQHAKIKWHEQG